VSRVRVLATGGTITGLTQHETGARYLSGAADAADLLASAPPMPSGVKLTWESISAVGSQDIDAAIWTRLHQAIVRTRAEDGQEAVVVTHGTDTMEETAFLLDLVLPAGAPVVLAGAMRPVDVLGSDGARNLATAVGVAADRASAGRGVLAVLGDEVYAARDVYKATTRGTQGLAGFPGGPVAFAQPGGVHYLAPAATVPWRGTFAFPSTPPWPTVAVLHAHADMSAAVANAVLDSGVDGVVLAGVGHGNASRRVLEVLARATSNGIAVVRTSQIPTGDAWPDREIDDDALGTVAAGPLSALKSRVLLQLLLADGARDRRGIQDAFNLFAPSPLTGGIDDQQR
jgi:L-asparaginase